MTKPLLVDQPNLSLAWAQAYLAIRQTPGHRIAPLSLTFTGFGKDDPVEDPGIRKTLDAVLDSSGKPSVQTVANTIFPQVLWRRAKGDRQALYAAYRESLPDFVALEAQQNKRGLYFARLIAFGLDHKTGERLPQFPKDALPEDGNQLEVIIKKCKKGVLAIKLQASVFDPGRDHVDDPRLSCNPAFPHARLPAVGPSGWPVRRTEVSDCGLYVDPDCDLLPSGHPARRPSRWRDELRI